MNEDYEGWEGLIKRYDEIPEKDKDIAYISEISDPTTWIEKENEN